MPRCWTGQLLISCALPTSLGQTFHLERTCCPSLELGSWIPKKQIAQQHVCLLLALLCPATKGWAVPVCDSVAAEARTASYRPCLCRTVTASITNHLFLHSPEHPELTPPGSYSHPHVFVCRHLVFSGWSCHYYYFSVIFLCFSSCPVSFWPHIKVFFSFTDTRHVFYNVWKSVCKWNKLLLVFRYPRLPKFFPSRQISVCPSHTNPALNRAFARLYSVHLH